MLKQFQEKYELLVQYYNSEKERLANYKELFALKEVDNSAVVSAARDVISYVRKNKWSSFLDWLNWMSVPSNQYLGCFTDEPRRFGAYGNIKDYSTQNTISSVIIYMNRLCDGMEAALPSLTVSNYEAVLNEVRYNAACSANISMDFAESTYHGGDVIRRFNKVLETTKIARLKHALYIESVINECEALVSMQPTVSKIKRTADHTDNIKQLKTLIEVHNRYVDAVSVFSDFPDETEELKKFYKKAMQTEAKAAAQKEYDNYKNDILNRIRSSVIGESIDNATFKKLKKSFDKASKLIRKGKLDDKKCFKIIPFPIGVGEFDIHMSDLTTALRSSRFDEYVALYHNSIVFNRVLKGEERKIISNKKRETEEQVALQIQRGSGSYVEKTQSKLSFIEKNFAEFYAFVGTALLDCLIELAYSGTFEEFDELPEELQTTAAVDMIIGYFKSKRVDTVKEAINFYYKEHKDDICPRTDEEIAADKERREGLEALREELKSQQSYLESFKRFESQKLNKHTQE